MFLQFVNVFCLLISCFVIGIYGAYYHVVLRIDYLDLIKAISLAALLITMPSLLKWFFGKKQDDCYWEGQYTIVMFFLSTILGWCAQIVGFNFSSAIIILGITSLLSGIIVCRKSLIKNKFLLLSVFVFFAIFYAIIIASSNYVIGTPTSPLLIQRIIVGRLTGDPIYLGGVASIINTYNIPALGINGIVYLHYHWGSIWFLVMFANLLHISIIKSYTLLYPAVFVPLMLKAFFLFCRQVSNALQFDKLTDKKSITIIIIVVALAISTIYPLSLIVDQSEFSSQSYTFALFFVFLSATIFLFIYKRSSAFTKMKKQEFWVLAAEFPLMLFLIGMTKVSVFYDAVLLYFYFLLRTRLYSRKFFVEVSVLLILVVIIIYYLSQAGSPVGKIIVHPFDCLHFESSHKYSYLIWLNYFSIFAYIYNFLIGFGHFMFFYFWSWMFFIAKYAYCRICQNGSLVINKRSYFDVEIVGFLFLINALPAYLLRIVGDSNYYFLDITRWSSIALFLSYLFGIVFLCDKSSEKC